MIFGKSERRDAAEGRDISERGGFREFLAGAVGLFPGCGGKRGKKLWKTAKSDPPQPGAGGRKKRTARKKAGAGFRLSFAEGNFFVDNSDFTRTEIRQSQTKPQTKRRSGEGAAAFGREPIDRLCIFAFNIKNLTIKRDLENF